MTDTDLRQKLIRIFRHQFDDGTLDETVSTMTCESWDSLGHIKLILAIEQEFGIEPVPAEIIAMYADFPAVERFVADKLASR